MLLEAPKHVTGRRLSGMDGLRAIACMTVLLIHTWQAGPAGKPQFGRAWSYVEPLATIGLVLFFTLSGFLLYSPFAVAIVRERGLPSISSYLRNRALRILPAYWVILLVVWLLSLAAQPDHQNAPGGVDSVGTALLNLTLLQSYTPHTNLTGIPPAWSLSVEVVFYLLLPLLALAVAEVARGRDMRSRLIALVAAPLSLLALGLVGKAVAHYAFGFSGYQASWDYVFQNSFLAKADLFCWGMVAAVVASALDQSRLARLPAAPIALLGWSAVIVSDFVHQSPLSALGFGLVILWVSISFARTRRGGQAAFLEWSPVLLAGTISYSVYLWHWPVILLLNKAGLAVSGWGGVIVDPLLVCAITLPLSYVTYRLVEAPAMRRKSPPTRPTEAERTALDAATQAAP